MTARRGRLLYSALASLDGCIADRDGRFDWAMPDEEVHRAVNDDHRGVGTYLYGRRLYETMVAWETMPADDGSSATDDFAALWRSAEKIVYSTTLASVGSARTSIRRVFDADEINRRKESGDLVVGGAGLAAAAFRSGLVDEVTLYLSPVVVGGGTAALPTDLRLDLTLVDTRRFSSGVVRLKYRVGR